MGLYSGRLIIGRIFASEFWGAYFWEVLFLFFWGGGGGQGGGGYYQNFKVYVPGKSTSSNFHSCLYNGGDAGTENSSKWLRE